MRALDQKHIIYNDPAIPDLVRVPGHQHHIHTLWKFRHDDILEAGSDGAPVFAPVRAADQPPLRSTTPVDRRLAPSPGRPMPALDASTFTALCFAPGDSDDGASTTDPLVVLFSQPWTRPPWRRTPSSCWNTTAAGLSRPASSSTPSARGSS